MRTLRAVACATLIALAGCGADETLPPAGEVHAFYYGWYGSAAVDGAPRHWNHEVLGVEGADPYPGGDDLGANYFPELGPYSSNDPAVLARHMTWCVEAGVDVLVASWWGAGSFEDDNLARLLDAAAVLGVTIAIHLEPFPGRGAETSREALAYLIHRYGGHPAFHRSALLGDRPVVYVYDSYLTPAEEWARVLRPEGDLTIRGTAYDAAVIGLWVREDEGAYFLTGGFDGVYTYFAADGFTYGSTSTNWVRLAAWARDRGLAFVPCVGPGYVDTRVRPWNASTTRPREDGAYFDRMFERAIYTAPSVVAITSFNEWHEGTQIEPAAPLSIEGYVYEDYAPLAPGDYLTRTRRWTDLFKAMATAPAPDTR